MFGENNSPKGQNISGMMGATTVMISMMPTEVIMEKLQDSLQNYKIIPNEENKKDLMMSLMTMTIKLDSEGKNPMDLLKEASEMEAQKNMMDKLSGRGLSQN